MPHLRNTLERRFAGLAALTLFAATASGCLIVNRQHLDSLEGGDAGEGEDGGPPSDGGTDGGSGLGIPLVDGCGDLEANYHVFDDSTGGQLQVDTRGMSNRVNSCGGRESPGREGFIAIDVIAGDQWHFHVVPDTSIPGQNLDPFLYLLFSPAGGCDSRDCENASDACQGPGDEHFAFIAPSDGRFYLGIDDRMAVDGGVYLIEAVRLFCGDGAKVHGESCDGSATCDTRCHEVLNESRTSEVIPNDNEIEANAVIMPATGPITLQGTIGGDLCVYPDVYTFSIEDANSALTVRMLQQDLTACTSGAITPFDVVLRNSEGEVRGPATTDANGCSILDVSGLASGTYFLYVEHDAPLETPTNYRMQIEVTP